MQASKGVICMQIQSTMTCQFIDDNDGNNFHNDNSIIIIEREEHSKQNKRQKTKHLFLKCAILWGDSAFTFSFWTNFALLRRMDARSFENDPLLLSLPYCHDRRVKPKEKNERKKKRPIWSTVFPAITVMYREPLNSSFLSIKAYWW